MIKNEAIRVAAEIVQAQSKAQATKNNQGVLFCNDAKKADYAIVPPGKMVTEEGELDKTLKELRNDVANLKAIVTSLETEYKNLKENYEQFKALVIDAFRTTEELIEDNEESGDPL